jgi:hypothetical protein
VRPFGASTSATFCHGSISISRDISFVISL